MTKKEKKHVLHQLKNIKNEKQYNELVKDNMILSAESLKYISQTRNFRKIIRYAREVV